MFLESDVVRGDMPFDDPSGSISEDCGHVELIQTSPAPIVHPKINSGKESVAHAEFGMRMSKWSAGMGERSGACSPVAWDLGASQSSGLLN